MSLETLKISFLNRSHQANKNRKITGQECKTTISSIFFNFKISFSGIILNNSPPQIQTARVQKPEKHKLALIKSRGKMQFKSVQDTGNCKYLRQDSGRSKLQEHRDSYCQAFFACLIPH